MDVINSSDNPPGGSAPCKVTLGTRVFNHFKDSFEQSYDSEQKAESQNVLIRNPFLAFFLFFGDLNISECPTKELMQCLQKSRKGTITWETRGAFLKPSAAGGRSSVVLLCDLFMTWICWFIRGLLASKQHDLTYIWRSRGLSWAVWGD